MEVSPVVFECAQCGECCTHMGLAHLIRKECTDREFLIENRYTGELTRVSIDPDKYGLHDDRSVLTVHPKACPFLRFDSDRKAFCTVHLTRPSICRDFGCWRILILDRSGRRAGRVIFRDTLMTEDAGVRRIWEDYLDRLGSIEPDSRDSELVRAFTVAGYVVRV